MLKIEPSRIAGAYRLTPERLPDIRGEFFEALRTGSLEEATGHRFTLRQVNISVSRRNTIRGIHGTALPPGQAKIVSCMQGAILDVTVDLRVGSRTFGMFEMIRQEAGSGISVYLADGLGHAFLALTDEARVCYLCSQEYVPGTMIEVDALDPEIGIPWPLDGEPIRSPKDAAAQTLAAAAAAGRLPTLERCLEAYESCQRRG